MRKFEGIEKRSGVGDATIVRASIMRIRSRCDAIRWEVTAKGAALAFGAGDLKCCLMALQRMLHDRKT